MKRRRSPPTFLSTRRAAPPARGGRRAVRRPRGRAARARHRGGRRGLTQRGRGSRGGQTPLSSLLRPPLPLRPLRGLGPLPAPAPGCAASHLQVTCLVQPPPLPSLPPPPPPAPEDGEVTVGIGVGEAAATAAAAAPAPDVVAVVPGAAASAITVYPTQQWHRNFRDHIVPVRLPEKAARRGEGKETGAPARSSWLRVGSPSPLAARTAGWSRSARGPPLDPGAQRPDWRMRQPHLRGRGRGGAPRAGPTLTAPPTPPTHWAAHLGNFII